MLVVVVVAMTTMLDDHDLFLVMPLHVAVMVASLDNDLRFFGAADEVSGAAMPMAASAASAIANLRIMFHPCIFSKMLIVKNVDGGNRFLNPRINIMNIYSFAPILCTSSIERTM